VKSESPSLNNKLDGKIRKGFNDMKDQDYLSHHDVKGFLEFLIRVLPKLSHRYQYIGKNGDPSRGQVWSTSSFLGACEDTGSSKVFTGYWWPFSCEVLSGNDFVHHEGYTMQKSSLALNELSKILLDAIRKNNDVKAQMACQGILAWGGVLKGNQQRIFNKSNGLCKHLLTLKALLEDPDLDDDAGADRIRALLWMNAGFTKIFASFVNDFCMYDGRVGAALGLLARDYCYSESKETVPELLLFPWGEGTGDGDGNHSNRRDPSDDKYTFPQLTPGKKHAMWNIRSNWLLKEMMKRLKIQKSNNVQALRRVESSLFMIGYDISRSRHGQLSGDGDEFMVPSGRSSEVDMAGLAVKDAEVKSHSKMECAKRSFNANKKLKRKAMLSIFQEECGLTKAGAATYYQKIRTEVGNN
jgi:hypothetical protein